MNQRCLVTGCTSKETRQYPTPTGSENYCPRHAQMLIWAEHVKTKEKS